MQVGLGTVGLGSIVIDTSRVFLSSAGEINCTGDLEIDVRPRLDAKWDFKGVVWKLHCAYLLVLMQVMAF